MNRERVSTILQHLSQGPHLRNDTCGIIAVVSQNEEAVPFLMEGLKIMLPRGYDSAGITTVDDHLITTKYASSGSTSDAIDLLEANTSIHKNNPVGIAHTRWATHGGRTDNNAHPHHDMRDRIAVAHNGVIENSTTLKKELLDLGVVFHSETDTEVIAQLIGHYVHTQDISTVEATKLTLNRLEGTWGLVILDKQYPDQVIAAKNGSPILIGVADGKTFVSSESSAFSRHTKEFISLEDDEVAVLTSKGTTLDRSRIEIAPKENIIFSPEPWSHWTIREIHEQPEAVARALNYGGRIMGDYNAKLGGLDENFEDLIKIDHLIIAACGTSFFAGLLGSDIMRQLHCFETIQVIDAAELSLQHLPEKGRSGLLVISQSGETKDVHRALTLCQQNEMPCFSVVNTVGSLIARSTNCGVYLNAGREHAVASTKAFTCQVTVLSLIAIWFANAKHKQKNNRKVLIEALHRLPTSLGMTINSIKDECKEIAKLLVEKEHMFVLGKGASLPIAHEAALKIKEITYIHAEGYGGGALKHGPYALIDDGTPIILFIMDDEHKNKMITVMEEVTTRNAFCIVITNLRVLDSRKHPDIVIRIPSNGPLTYLLAIIPVQLLAFEISILKGINPDFPRNLAKSITVD
eukprot:TRINITY_DN6121_c0_g2_i2.p1 TRINITY_DN6121_c0_g2~~TRINITY_DN6121_c0_g2_i2.p1  ORF type:complete len:634 (-),score=111.52 TRINITY_DN6121_c0_g2_i2:1801-3702(-)